MAVIRRCQCWGCNRNTNRNTAGSNIKGAFKNNALKIYSVRVFRTIIKAPLFRKGAFHFQLTLEQMSVGTLLFYSSPSDLARTCLSSTAPRKYARLCMLPNWQFNYIDYRQLTVLYWGECRLQGHLAKRHWHTDHVLFGIAGVVSRCSSAYSVNRR